MYFRIWEGYVGNGSLTLFDPGIYTVLKRLFSNRNSIGCLAEWLRRCPAIICSRGIVFARVGSNPAAVVSFFASCIFFVYVVFSTEHLICQPSAYGSCIGAQTRLFGRVVKAMPCYHLQLRHCVRTRRFESCSSRLLFVLLVIVVIYFLLGLLIAQISGHGIARRWLQQVRVDVV